MGVLVWRPATAGTSIEIPARAPGLPANLWIHIAANITNWNFPLEWEGTLKGDWNHQSSMALLEVEPGDISVASLCLVGLAGIHREKQGIFDSNIWGTALNSLSPVAPGALEFTGDFATAGRSWPGGIWMLADVLVLRPSLIQPVPVPYGTYPPPSHHWIWPFQKYVELIQNIQHLTSDQLKLLRRLNVELQELLASYDLRNTEGPLRPTIKPAKVSLKIVSSATALSSTHLLTANAAPAPAPPVKVPPAKKAAVKRAAKRRK